MIPQKGYSFRAEHSGYRLLVELSDHGWRWLAENIETGARYDSPVHLNDAETAKQGAVQCVAIMTGEFDPKHNRTLGDIYKLVYWEEHKPNVV